jgi:pSer/pThr/pTyr-binding forkhead associated (FHA) protein/predicted Ser/Thr protein kinase
MNCSACGQERPAEASFCPSCGATASDGAHSLVGQVLAGRYHIVRVLGEGGTSVVYLAKQKLGATARDIAIKTLHADLSRDPSVLRRFERECGLVAQLDHPNTIRVFDFGSTDDGTLFMAMEYVRGKPLATVITQDGALPLPRALHIVKQIGAALAEAHQHGVVHRDLKPENVILTTHLGTPDFVKLLDFGIATQSGNLDGKREQRLTPLGTVLGVPPYMSPEQFTGKEADTQSDLYSLGIVTYEMLTGQLPFQADSAWNWATQHMTAAPRPFESFEPTTRLPEHVKRAVLRALEKSPRDRQASVESFLDELSGAGASPEPSRAAPNRVFVSYAAEDEQYVKETLIPRLEAAGFPVWWAQLIPGGVDFQTAIRTAIETSDWVLVALSASATSSNWVKAETQLAIDSGRGVVPVIIKQPCQPNRCHMHFGIMHRYDLTRDTEATFARLLARLRADPNESHPSREPDRPRAEPVAAPQGPEPREHLLQTQLGKPAALAGLERAEANRLPQPAAGADRALEEPDPSSPPRRAYPHPTLTIDTARDGSIQTIGRHFACQIQISHEQVSSQHAQLHWENGELFVEDLGSSNGTFVRGRRLEPHARVPLTLGEKIFVGPIPVVLGRAFRRATLQGPAGFFSIDDGMPARAGRDDSKCVVLLQDPGVSGVHASLKIERGRFWVRDEVSNNGTYIDQTRAASGMWTDVPAGSSLRFGPIAFSVRLE